MLYYSDFNNVFDIHIDSSEYQMRTIISRNGRSVAYRFKKLTNTQKKYLTTDQGLLPDVECLKQYKVTILG